MRFKFRLFTGPVAVREVTERLCAAGIEASAGTEHVWGVIEAPSKGHARRFLDPIDRA